MRQLHTLQDIPGYISPNSRLKMLGDVGNTNVEVSYSSDEGLPRTMLCDDMQDTAYEEVYGSPRKNSLGSFSSGLDDKSSRSTSSKQRSEGRWAVG